MKTYCLDTNAILDFCYRYYPPELFANLWEQVESAVVAKQIQFISTEHINKEVRDKISAFCLDISVFDDFSQRVALGCLSIDTYEYTLLEIKTDLVKIVPAYKEKIQKIDNLSADLSNIAAVKNRGSAVLTSEQGITTDISTLNKALLKIPDVCRHYKIECSNWVGVFTFLGVRF